MGEKEHPHFKCQYLNIFSWAQLKSDISGIQVNRQEHGKKVGGHSGK